MSKAQDRFKPTKAYIAEDCGTYAFVEHPLKSQTLGSYHHSYRRWKMRQASKQ